MTLLVLMSGCTTGLGGATSGIPLLPHLEAACSELEPLTDAHNGGLLADGGPVSLTTGTRLLAGIDGLCRED